MNAEEAKAVLEAGDVAFRAHQWNEVDELLRNLHAQHLLQGTDQGDAALFLGVAAMHLGAWEEAQTLLTEAATTASGEHQAEARANLAQITRHTSAVAAEDGGVDQSESSAVLAAADDALGRGDLDEAYQHYWAVYDGQAEDGPRAKAAVGLAGVFAHRGDLVQGKQYAEYAIGTKIPTVQAAAKELVTWIAEQEQARAAAADGTTPDEYERVRAAARQAYAIGDWEHAAQLHLSVYNATTLGSVERARAAYNIAVCSMMRGQPAEARTYLDFALAHGAAKTVGLANQLLHDIETEKRGEELAPQLDDND